MEKKLVGVYFNQRRENPEVIEIENKLESVQELVGGFIELVNPEMFDNFDERIRGLDIWINEEGRINGEDIPNISLNSDYGLESIIYGSLVVLNSDEEGNFKSIEKNRWNSIIECLKEMRKR